MISNILLRCWNKWQSALHKTWWNRHPSGNKQFVNYKRKSELEQDMLNLPRNWLSLSVLGSRNRPLKNIMWGIYVRRIRELSKLHSILPTKQFRERKRSLYAKIESVEEVLRVIFSEYRYFECYRYRFSHNSLFHFQELGYSRKEFNLLECVSIQGELDFGTHQYQDLYEEVYYVTCLLQDVSEQFLKPFFKI